MGLLSRVIKGAGVDPEDREILGEYVWDQESRHTIHGSDPKWQGAVALGSLMRGNGKPKPAPWSRETRRP